MADALHESQPSVIKRRVFFTGTTAIVQGQGFCYERDRVTTATGETATDPFGKRDKYVELPSADNNMAFAGVAVQNYAANASGQWIDIYEPGSVCEVLVGVATTVGSTLLNCTAGGPAAGAFVAAGFPGRGAAVALQTTDTPTTTSTQAAPIGASLDGTASIAADGKTITDTDLFLYAKAGDKVVILAGGTTANGTANVVAGVYTLDSRTSKDVGVLIVPDPVICAAASIILCYVVRENPLVMCKLLDGEESGLVDFVATKNNAETVPAAMVGGTTIIAGGNTIAADSKTTVANPTKGVRRKAFLLRGALTTKDMIITPTSSNIMGMAVAGTLAALTTFKIDAAAGSCLLDWDGNNWTVVGGLGVGA